jgi:hypothetical protein
MDQKEDACVIDDDSACVLQLVELITLLPYFVRHNGSCSTHSMSVSGTLPLRWRTMSVEGTFKGSVTAKKRNGDKIPTVKSTMRKSATPPSKSPSIHGKKTCDAGCLSMRGATSFALC